MTNNMREQRLGAIMRNLATVLSAAIMLTFAALPVRAEMQQSPAAASLPHRPNATMFARNIKCGGEDLKCGPSLAKVCNQSNGKCCCLIDDHGTFR